MPRPEGGTTLQLYFQHYAKPMASQLLIMARSAMPAKVKRTSLAQYVLRILRNCKLELEWETKARKTLSFPTLLLRFTFYFQ